MLVTDDGGRRVEEGVARLVRDGHNFRPPNHLSRSTIKRGAQKNTKNIFTS